MKRCGRLADLLAVAARELLPHGLDHFPLPGDELQGTGHVLTELAEPVPTTARACCRRIDHHALPGQVVGKGSSRFRALTHEPCDGRGLGDGKFRRDLIFGGAGLQLLELEFHLILKLGAPFLAGPIELALQLGDPERLMRDQGLIVGGHGLGHRQLGRGIEMLLFCRRCLGAGCCQRLP